MSFRFSTWGRTDDGEGGSVGGDRRGGDVIGEGGDGGGGQASREGIWGVDDCVRGWRGKQLVGRSAWTVRWGELLGYAPLAGLGGRASADGGRSS